MEEKELHEWTKVEPIPSIFSCGLSLFEVGVLVLVTSSTPSVASFDMSDKFILYYSTNKRKLNLDKIVWVHSYRLCKVWTQTNKSKILIIHVKESFWVEGSVVQFCALICATSLAAASSMSSAFVLIINSRQKASTIHHLAFMNRKTCQAAQH